MLIRKKILCTTILLNGILLLLMLSSLRGVYAYRDLTKSIGALSYEVQEMWSLGQEVADLRSYFRRTLVPTTASVSGPKHLTSSERADFLAQVDIVRSELSAHRKRIENHIEADPLLAGSANELQLVDDIFIHLREIEDLAYDYQSNASTQSTEIVHHLDNVGLDAQSLFVFMTDRMRTFRERVRSSYHTWIVIIISSSVASFIIVFASFMFFRKSVVQPFKVLLSGSRRIAGGDFNHRIILQSHDELAELADAQNKMTNLFVEIKNNLDEKVKLRTQEVVRSEQLASVGFLAAGVAHEINNPLASIAWSAEALESRLHEFLHASEEPSGQVDMEAAVGSGLDPEEQEVLRRYLRRIQDEAFRCKGITERLLDFSRLGETQKKQYTNIFDSVSDVIELVRHLGQYRNRTIAFTGNSELHACVSPPEFKQVVLNLLTNSLDASNDGGTVRVALTREFENFVLRIEDDGCGMSQEVMQHLFEPFFTRRRDGRGTGLGLSITYRIVQDHDGTLVPYSPGPGQGSTFILTIPIISIDNAQDNEDLQAA